LVWKTASRSTKRQDMLESWVDRGYAYAHTYIHCFVHIGEKIHVMLCITVAPFFLFFSQHARLDSGQTPQ